MTRTEPSSVSHSVSSTSVSGRYARRVQVAGAFSPFGPFGAIRQCPLSSSPSSFAKQAAESNLGRQSQSIDPSGPTRAAVW
ncbi:hypothetical protein QF026_006614 [Streptomyces aurantiacus]|nr:hypothetical protein [Streptomyces aurantiacus]